MAYISFQPNDYFSTLLYSGNSSARSLTGVGFAPSFVWIKERTSTSDHMLFDQPRGVQKYISSNLGNAEQTSAAMLTAFDSDGFSLGSGNDTNDNGQTYVSWNWKANGQGSSNTDGSINTTYTSADTTSGVSICKWTGSGANATIGHGLGVIPQTYLIKNLDTSDSWNCYHESVGNTHRIFLDTDGGDNNDDTAFNDTSPTSSVFSVGTNTGTNKSSSNMIAYVFADKKGFSKFGHYTGNGNADGSFIYTGFEPNFIMIKCSSHGSTNWTMYDASRDGYNEKNYYLYANEANTESTTTHKIDILSNGFKCRADSSDTNTAGRKYLYWSFAKNPFVASNGTPATAR
jgi:hypothetical protein